MIEKHEERQKQVEDIVTRTREMLAACIHDWRLARGAGVSYTGQLAARVTHLRMTLADPRPTSRYERWQPRTRDGFMSAAVAIREALKLLDKDDITDAYAVWAKTPMYDIGPKRLREFMAAWQRDARRLNDEWTQVNFKLSSLNTEQSDALAHFITCARVHVSTEDSTKVAYFQSLRHMVADRVTRTTPGRLLTKYFGPGSANPILSEVEIKALAERFTANVVSEANVKFIENTDPDGWQRVYEDGPSSCMRGEDCVRVYARPGNGLRLAFLGDADGVVARAIVREDTTPKQYVRVYPNPDDDHALHTGFKAVLEAMGYVHGNLDGVKLVLDECSGGYVCPYIDCGRGGSQSGRVGYDSQGGYLQVHPDGDMSLDNTGGYVEDGRVVCDDCDERYDEDDTEYSGYLGRRICCNCRNGYVMAITDRYRTRELAHEDDVIFCESDDEYYVESVEEYYDIYQCAASGNWYEVGELTTCDVGTYADEQVRSDCVKQDCVTNEFGHEDDFTETADGWVFDDYLETCFISGNERHRDYLIQVRLPGKATVWFDPEDMDLAQLRKHFLVCGPIGGQGILVPRDYFGRELDASVYWHTPRNIVEGDSVQVSFDDLVEDLKEDDTVVCLTPVAAAQPEYANV